MQVGERHVLIVEKPPAVKSVLDELSAGVGSDGGIGTEIRRGFEEFSNHGGTRMILDLQVIEPSSEESPDTIRNITAYLLGEILIITGQVAFSWILQIKEHSQRHSFPRHLQSSLGTLISNTVDELETAVERIASPVRQTKGNLGRAHAR